MDRNSVGQLVLRKSSIFGADLHVWVPLILGVLVVCFLYYQTRR